MGAVAIVATIYLDLRESNRQIKEIAEAFCREPKPRECPFCGATPKRRFQNQIKRLSITLAINRQANHLGVTITGLISSNRRITTYKLWF